MKARGGLAILVCALAAMALPGAASGKSRELTFSTPQLKGTNGYDVALTTLRQGKRAPYVELQASRAALSARYEVRGKDGAGIHASFGPLGQLDFAFKRQSKSVERPERGCRWVSERGVFRGSISFAGEDEYVAASARNPKGEVLRLPDGFCGFDDRRGPLGIPNLPNLRETVLRARGPGGSGRVAFEASRFDADGQISFSATLSESLGAMKIQRTAITRGRKGAFPTSGASHARVFPPAPFTGSAEFLDPAQGPPSWTGDLAVSFPGAPETLLAGESFAAKLCPHQPILVECRLSRQATH